MVEPWNCYARYTRLLDSNQDLDSCYSRISHNLIFPCSFPTARYPPSGDSAMELILPRGVLSVGQFLYSVQLGRWTSLRAFFFHRDDITSIWPSSENSRLEIGVVSWSNVRDDLGRSPCPWERFESALLIHPRRSYNVVIPLDDPIATHRLPPRHCGPASPPRAMTVVPTAPSSIHLITTLRLLISYSLTSPFLPTAAKPLPSRHQAKSATPFLESTRQLHTHCMLSVDRMLMLPPPFFDEPMRPM